MIRIVKAGLEFQCDTADDVRLAMGVLNDVYMGPFNDSPSWRVGGPPVDPDPDDDPMARGLELVTKISDTVTEVCSIEPQYIPVRAKCLEVLEAVMLFPDGVPCSGLETLLGLSEKQVSGRVQMLKRAGLVESVPGHRLWRATTLARRAKLVAS